MMVFFPAISEKTQGVSSVYRHRVSLQFPSVSPWDVLRILCQDYFSKLFQPCSQNAGFSVHVLSIKKFGSAGGRLYLRVSALERF